MHTRTKGHCKGRLVGMEMVMVIELDVLLKPPFQTGPSYAVDGVRPPFPCSCRSVPRLCIPAVRHSTCTWSAVMEGEKCQGRSPSPVPCSQCPGMQRPNSLDHVQHPAVERKGRHSNSKDVWYTKLMFPIHRFDYASKKDKRSAYMLPGTITIALCTSDVAS